MKVEWKVEGGVAEGGDRRREGGDRRREGGEERGEEEEKGRM